jgi:hypothetical protein
MVLVRSFIREISPILCVLVLTRLVAGVSGRSIPVYKGLSTKNHGEELRRVLCSGVSIEQEYEIM